MADARRIHDAPCQRLHAAERTAHYGGKLADAECVGQSRLRMDPILDRDYREIRTIRLAASRVKVHRAGGAETRTGIINANDKKLVGVQRFARPYHVVPPADAFLAAFASRIFTGDVMRCIQCVTHQYRVRMVGVQGAVGFIH